MESPQVNANIELLPVCPFLPRAEGAMDWRSMAAHGEDRGPEFYRTALGYGQYLWQRRLPARAILCLDRAMGADLRGNELVLREWPMPYAAMAWVLEHLPEGVFAGNPRVHFQHYADRMNEPRKEQRRWRAWACWALVRAVRPELAGDPRHNVVEPSVADIREMLDLHGHVGESELWCGVLGDLGANRSQ